MASNPNITVNAQPAAVTASSTGTQSKASAVNMRKKLNGQNDALDQAAETIVIPNPGAKDRNQTLLERGVSVVRPEIIAATEFIPLVNDNDPSDATFTMSSGDQEYRVDITNAARLIEMQLVAQKMLIKNTDRVINSYAGQNLSSLMRTALMHLQSSYVPDVKLVSFTSMKSQIKQILESAQIEVQEVESGQARPSTSSGKTRGGKGKTRSRGGMTHPGKGKTRGGGVNQTAQKRANRLAKVFKNMDQEYANLVLEYIARKMIVSYTNEFLAELARLKVTTNKIYDVINLNQLAIASASSSEASIKELVDILDEQVFGTVRSFKMSEYISESLKVSPVALSGHGCSSLNLALVIKALSADMQFKRRAVESAYGQSMIADGLNKGRVPATAIDQSNGINGSAGYETFNIATFFGNPARSYNMVTQGNGGQNFSDYAYDRVRTILAANNRHFNTMLTSGESLNFAKIEAGVLPLLGKVLTDLSLHNNLAVKNSSTDYKAAWRSGVTLSSSDLATGFNVEAYCKMALFDGKLSSTQDISTVLRNYNAFFIKRVLSSYSPVASAPVEVLPIERNSAKIDNDGKYYIPGADHFFDEGVKELVNSDEDSVTFSELTNFAGGYGNAVNYLISDFKLMRGLTDEASAAPNAEGANGTVSSLILVDKLNNRIADLLDDQLNVSNPAFGSIFALLVARQAHRDDYFFSTLMTYFMLRNTYYGVNTGREEKTSSAYHSAFFWERNPGSSKKRQRTYAVGDDGEENDSDMKHVSIPGYCLSSMFLEIYSTVFRMTKTGENAQALSDDFDLWQTNIKERKYTYNNYLIDDEEEGTLDVASASYEKFLKTPFQGFYDALCLQRTGSGNGNSELLKQFINLAARVAEGNTNFCFSRTANETLHQVIGASGTSAAARRSMITNGGYYHYRGSEEQFRNRSDDGKLALNTNRMRTYLGLNSTAELRMFAVLSYILSILGKIACFRVIVDEGVNDCTLKTYRKVTRAAIAALRGEKYDKNKHARKAYFDVNRIIRGLKLEAVKNNEECLKHFLVLKSQSYVLKNQVSEIDRFIKGAGGGNDYRHALKYYQESGIGKRLMSFLGPSMVASNKYSQMSLIEGSSQAQSFPACDVFSSQQLQNMITYFNQPDKGFYARETNPVLSGRKTVMHVGIPAGMLENLQFESIGKSGDETFDGSTLIMVTIYRKDVLNSKSYVYPKTFVFDMSRFTLEGMNNISNGQLSGETFLSADDLISKTNLHKIDGFGQVSKLPAGRAYAPWGMFGFKNEPNYSPNFQKSVFLNHLNDHYFKMYFKLMMGLDFKEYVFQLTPDSALRIGPDGNNVNLLNKIRETNLLLFPKASEDINSARELEKINRGIANSLYFNSEHYMKACIYPNVFDRVFSLLVNERDFIYASGDPLKDKSTQFYAGAAPVFKTDLGIEAISNIQIPLSQMSPTKNYYNNTRNKDYPQVYMYYAQITLMKRIELPSY